MQYFRAAGLPNLIKPADTNTIKRVLTSQVNVLYGYAILNTKTFFFVKIEFTLLELVTTVLDKSSRSAFSSSPPRKHCHYTGAFNEHQKEKKKQKLKKITITRHNAIKLISPQA